MDGQDLGAPQEASRDPIEIREDDAITIDEAIILARDLPFDLGKSTLQRWAKHWKERGGGVRSLLVDTTAGKFYKLSRQDFEAWLFDQKQNRRPREVSRDLERPHETPQDLKRPREVSHEVPQENARIKELENENLQLKIDVGVRKQLLERAKDEMDSLRSMTHNLLRENGSLEHQLRQLSAPTKREVDQPAAPVDNSPQHEPTVGV